MKNANVYEDREVLVAMNNLAVALTKWRRLQPSLREHPNRLRAFSVGVLEMVREAVGVVQGGGQVITLTDAEIALCLQVAALMAVLDSDFVPENSPVRTLFAASLTRAREEAEG